LPQRLFELRRGTAAEEVALMGVCATLEDAASPPAKSITPMTGIGISTFVVTAQDDQDGPAFTDACWL
jgi:hypothetical protein